MQNRIACELPGYKLELALCADGSVRGGDGIRRWQGSLCRAWRGSCHPSSASLASVLFGIMSSAAFACLASMQIAVSPSALRVWKNHTDGGPVSNTTRFANGARRRGTAAIAAGSEAHLPRQTPWPPGARKSPSRSGIRPDRYKSHMVVLHSMSGPGVHREPLSASYRGTTTTCPEPVDMSGRATRSRHITPCGKARCYATVPRVPGGRRGRFH